MKNSKFKIQNSKFFILGLILITSVSSCSIGDWRVYETSEFTIEFPGLARDTVTMEANVAGSKSYFEPIEGALDSNLYYSVSMYSLSDSISVVQENIKELFDTDVQIYAWSIGGTLADSGRVVKSGDVEGREYKVTIAGNRGIATVRKFALGKHLYTLLVITENSRLDNKAIAKFMDSFKLKKGMK